MQQPLDFIDKTNPTFVCKLRIRKAIYGLKQAPRAWYNELKGFLLSYGFVNSHSDTSLFIYHTPIVEYLIVTYMQQYRLS